MRKTKEDALKREVKILAIDFDGVLHSYTSGWKGPTQIPDPPVKGAFTWLRDVIDSKRFEVHIFSSRLRYPWARRAMRRWFIGWGLESRYIDELRWATSKPPAHMMLDDRAVQFRGVFPAISGILRFKPWNQKDG